MVSILFPLALINGYGYEKIITIVILLTVLIPSKKYFYSYDGEGLRYEIQEFISMIVNKRRSSYKMKKEESIAIAEIIEQYHVGKHLVIL